MINLNFSSDSWDILIVLSADVKYEGFLSLVTSFSRSLVFSAAPLVSLLLPPPPLSNALSLSLSSSLFPGGGHHAGECGQGFGKRPEALRAGWQSRCSAGRSLPVWKLRSQAKKQVLVEKLQGGHVTGSRKTTDVIRVVWGCSGETTSRMLFNFLLMSCRWVWWGFRENGKKMLQFYWKLKEMITRTTTITNIVKMTFSLR